MLQKLAFTLALLIPTTTFAHQAPSGWTYPIECCSSMDCAPVESWSRTTPSSPTELSQLIITTKFGTIVIPPNFPLRQSGDNNMHACMRPGQNGQMRLLCVFIPGGN